MIKNTGFWVIFFQKYGGFYVWLDQYQWFRLHIIMKSQEFVKFTLLKRKWNIFIFYISLKVLILVKYLHYRQISALSLKYLYYFSKISHICKKSLKTILSSSAKDNPFKIICKFYQIKIYHANISVICYLQKHHIVCFLP